MTARGITPWMSIALSISVFPIHAKPGSRPNAAPGGQRLSLSALCPKQSLRPDQIFVGAADFRGDGKKSVVAVTIEGRVQVWAQRGNRFVTMYGPASIPQWKL